MTASHLLPERIREKIALMPEFHSGVHRVTVELSDGTVYAGVEVAWQSEVIRVPPYTEVPFRPEDVVDVHVTP